MHGWDLGGPVPEVSEPTLRAWRHPRERGQSRLANSEVSISSTYSEKSVVAVFRSDSHVAQFPPNPFASMSPGRALSHVAPSLWSPHQPLSAYRSNENPPRVCLPRGEGNVELFPGLKLTPLCFPYNGRVFLDCQGCALLPLFRKDPPPKERWPYPHYPWAPQAIGPEPFWL